MGLDGVEIVVAVEEAYDIRIEDSEAESIRTPRQLIDLVFGKVAQVDSTTCLTHRAFNRVRRFLVNQFGLPRKMIVPAATLPNLLPKTRLRELAICLPTELGTCPLPLVRPAWLTAGILTLPMLVGIVAVPVSVLIAIATAIFGAVLAERSTRRFRTELPKELTRIADLTGWVVAHKPDLAGEPRKGWTREQVAAGIREIVIQQLGCEARYSEDSLFVEDLGLD